MFNDAQTFQQRRFFRRLMIGWTIVGGLVFVLFFEGFSLGPFPVRWVGYMLIGIGLLGLFGFNVWWGGPLDLRRDQPESGDDIAS